MAQPADAQALALVTRAVFNTYEQRCAYSHADYIDPDYWNAWHIDKTNWDEICGVHATVPNIVIYGQRLHIATPSDGDCHFILYDDREWHRLSQEYADLPDGRDAPIKNLLLAALDKFQQAGGVENRVAHNRCLVTLRRLLAYEDFHVLADALELYRRTIVTSDAHMAEAVTGDRLAKPAEAKWRHIAALKLSTLLGEGG